MTVHFVKEIEKLKKKLLALGAQIEQSVWRAVESIHARDIALAEQVIEGDSEIDEKEVEIEEDCLKILALHQPVAIDLRTIVAILKINNDLERIADLAVNIAQCTESLAVLKHIGIPFDFATMAEITQEMLRNSLDALVNRDCALARKVAVADDEVDLINEQMYRIVERETRRQSEDIAQLILYLMVSKNLERIADLATNIAEDVIYLIDGEIVRHRLGKDRTSC